MELKEHVTRQKVYFPLVNMTGVYLSGT